MYFHLGALGDLRELPPIERDQTVDATAAATIGEHVSLTGARIIDRLGPHRRVWELTWVYLTRDQVDEIDSLRRGLLGWPLWLVDPQRPNLAPPQVATAGTERRSTAGWTSQAGARRWVQLPTVPNATVRSVGAIEWERATIADVLSVGRSTTTQRTPLLPGSGPVSVSAYLRRTSAAAAQVQVGIDFWLADGNRSTSLATATTPGQNVWIDLGHSATPPAGAVAFSPVWTVAAGQPSSIFQISGVRVGYGATPPAPSTGGGTALVYPRTLPETYPSQDEISCGLTLVEM